MILTKLDRYLYESKRKELNDIVNLSFDELIEALAQASEPEREYMISKLNDSTKKKIKDIIEGGLL